MAKRRASDTREKTNDFRERVLFTAEYLFLNSGKNSVTLRNIATNMQYTHSALLYYFNDKEAILQALRQRFATHCQREVRTQNNVPDSIQERLYNVMLSYLQYAQQFPLQYSLLFADTDCANTEHSVDATLLADFRTALSSAALSISNDALTFTLYAACHGIITRSISQQSAQLIPQAIRHAEACLLCLAQQFASAWETSQPVVVPSEQPQLQEIKKKIVEKDKIDKLEKSDKPEKEKHGKSKKKK